MIRKMTWIFVLMMALLTTFSCARQNKEKDKSTETTEQMTEENLEAESHANDIKGKDFAPDFTLNDINGKSFKLSSLRGKHVVLDFWGAWCVWCIRGIPKMKEYYAKYDGKFEIVGIDCHDSQEDWKETVKAQQMPWLHVYMPDDSSLLQTYQIQGFPTKVIVAPDGTIIQTFIGESEEFYTMLDSLFQ